MGFELHGKLLLGFSVILLGSFTHAFVPINNLHRIGNDEHVNVRQKNDRSVVSISVVSSGSNTYSSSSGCTSDAIRPVEGSGCKLFVKCVFGHWYHEHSSCPPNLLWNKDKSSCDYAYNVNVRTCTSSHHVVYSNTPSTTVRTVVPTSRVQTHDSTCGPFKCVRGSCSSVSHCDGHGHCEAREQCTCDYGYIGDNCDQLKVNGHHCVNQGIGCHHGWCVQNLAAEYACYCHKGYTGKGCEKYFVDDSNCSAKHLHCLHGECVYDTIRRECGCDCSDRFTGNECNILKAPGTVVHTTIAVPTTTKQPTHVPQHSTTCAHYECFHGKCATHSHCYNNHCSNYQRCDCYSGYTGENCNQRTVNLNHCHDAGLNCHYGCVYDTVQSEYACHCSSSDWTGRDCLLSKSQESHCWNVHLQCHHGECVHPHNHNNYFCHCTPEYTGKQCSLRIASYNDCKAHGFHCIHGQCLHDTSSISHSTSYSCDCHQGYTGAHCDTQIATANTTSKPTASTASSTTTTILASTTTMHATSRTSTTTKVPTTTTTSTVAPSTTQTTTAKPVTTSTAASTTSTPSTTPTTTVTIHYNTCDKLATVLDLGNQTPVNDTNGGSCPSGSLATPEAFVFEHCNVKPSSSWTQGVKLMSQCSGIPLYTPVATFFNQMYASSGGLSGIFLGCLQNGFKLGVQQCGILPSIIHVNYGGLFTMNPDLYYTVQ